MIAKAKVISHGANAIRYSVDKDKAEIVKTNLLPDDISPTAMWARMLALQKKFEDKLNRYHPLKRNMIRMEVSPTAEETQGWTMEDWQRLADDFIREFDAVDLSARSRRKSAKATNLKDSQYESKTCSTSILLAIPRTRKRQNSESTSKSMAMTSPRIFVWISASRAAS